ncbi:hypothetical protein LZ31DRAFT_374608 [Colletotrichum somersetense]|nr:hypothetical protein LZ31DRAFT_374608 [Colletotrichum somersetense]
MSSAWTLLLPHRRWAGRRVLVTIRGARQRPETDRISLGIRGRPSRRLAVETGVHNRAMLATSAGQVAYQACYANLNNDQHDIRAHSSFQAGHSDLFKGTRIALCSSNCGVENRGPVYVQPAALGPVISGSRPESHHKQTIGKWITRGGAALGNVRRYASCSWISNGSEPVDLTPRRSVVGSGHTTNGKNLYPRAVFVFGMRPPILSLPRRNIDRAWPGGKIRRLIVPPLLIGCR